VKKLFLAFSLTGLLLGCAEEKEKVPAGLLPEAKLISILADIHIAESRVELSRYSPDTSGVIFKQLQQEIYKKHHVSEAQFNKTYNYYLEHITALDKIYERLVDTLGMREIKAPATIKEPVKADSNDRFSTDSTLKSHRLRKIETMKRIRAQRTK
jgi:hypothetical protein